MIPPSIKCRRKIILKRPSTFGAFPQMEVPQKCWLIIENPIRMYDLIVPLFRETTICMLFV